MARNYTEQSGIRRYLLRQLTENQAQLIEQRLLVDDDFLDELESEEAQLVDDYVADQLTATERQQFDEYFLATPKRHQELQFARVLNRYVASHPIHKQQRVGQTRWQHWESQPWGLRVAAGVAAVGIIALALWFAIPRASSPGTLATITLTISAGNRAASDSIQKLPVPSGPLKVVLRLPESASPGASYRVKLIGGDGEMRTLEVAEREAQTVSVVIPVTQLKRGAYALKLLKLNADGTEQPVNGSYLFALE